MSDKPKTTNVKAIKTFFERDDQFAPGGGRKVGMAELKDLTPDDRAELGVLCAAELGMEVEPSKK